jgi:hypothetical protein
MKKIFVWFAGFFQDRDNSASSKRATLYIALFFLWMIIKGNLDGEKVDQEVLLVVGAIILWCVGAITGEFVSKYLNKNGEKETK